MAHLPQVHFCMYKCSVCTNAQYLNANLYCILQYQTAAGGNYNILVCGQYSASSRLASAP